MGTDYKIASGIDYKILDDNIGYIRYESFTEGIGSGNLTEVLNYMLLCRGLIIDIRNNGGGTLTYAERIAARFVQGAEDACDAFFLQLEEVVGDVVDVGDDSLVGSTITCLHRQKSCWL